MPDGRRHSPHLPVLAFDQFESNPAIGNIFADTNRRVARWHLRLRLKQPCAARQCFVTLNLNATRETPKRLRGRDALHLRPVRAAMAVLRMQQALVQFGFVAQQQQSFGVRVETANRIDIFWKTKLCKRAIGRTVRRELRKHAVGFVERDEHCGNFLILFVS